VAEHKPDAILLDLHMPVLDGIAAQLFVSNHTIKTHISRIFAKTGSRDRAAAIGYAHRHGIDRCAIGCGGDIDRCAIGCGGDAFAARESAGTRKKYGGGAAAQPDADGGTACLACIARTGAPRGAAPPHSVTIQACSSMYKS
jgi:Bacterial regulatory proteins, luxR family